MMTGKDEVYPLTRDKNESNRLNKQHAMIMELFGGPIDKIVPLNKVSSVADVATGTGIWIEAAQKRLNEIPSEHPRHYYGFDISDAQFPPHLDNATFVVQDVLKPFPAQHLSSYDFVHVRLLCGALKEREYNNVAANLISLLKPGGHLQWAEIDTSSLIEDMEAGSDRAKCEKLFEPLYDYIRIFGLSKVPHKTVHNACGEVGFADISSQASGLLEHPQLKTEFQHWHLEAFSSMMPRIFEKLRQVPHSTAKNMAIQWSNELQNILNDGCLVGGTFHSVTCQKPLAFEGGLS